MFYTNEQIQTLPVRILGVVEEIRRKKGENKEKLIYRKERLIWIKRTYPFI